MGACNRIIYQRFLCMESPILYHVPKWLLLSWLLHKQKREFLIPTLRSENLADVLTQCFSLRQGDEDWSIQLKRWQGSPTSCLYPPVYVLVCVCVLGFGSCLSPLVDPLLHVHFDLHPLGSNAEQRIRATLLPVQVTYDAVSPIHV